MIAAIAATEANEANEANEVAAAAVIAATTATVAIAAIVAVPRPAPSVLRLRRPNKRSKTNAKQLKLLNGPRKTAILG